MDGDRQQDARRLQRGRVGTPRSRDQDPGRQASPGGGIDAAVTATATIDDHALLAAYAERNDEAAFAELVRSHEPLVHRACLQVLRAAPDADDASQQVFLALARRATELVAHPNLGGWLHRTAWNVAMRARAADRARRQREAEADAPRPESTPADAQEDGTAALLRRELAALPEKYRVAIELHHFGGLTKAEIARELGCNESAVSMRLTRGREQLRQRLERAQKRTLPAVALLALLDQPAVAAGDGPPDAEIRAPLAGATIGVIGLGVVGVLVVAVLMLMAAPGVVGEPDDPVSQAAPMSREPIAAPAPARRATGMVRTPTDWGAYRLTGLAPAADGGFVAVGTSTTDDGRGVVRFARFRSDGTIDAAFGDGGRADAGMGMISGQVLVRDDGSLVGTGGLPGRQRVVALLADGRPDPSFGDGGVAPVPLLPLNTTVPGLRLAMDGTGSLLVAGRPAPGSGARSLSAVLRLDRNGRIEAGFGERANASLQRWPGESVVALTRGGTGATLLTAGARTSRIIRLDASGADLREADTWALEGATAATTSAIVRDDRGALAIAGSSDGELIVWRLLADGVPDPAFGTGGRCAHRIGTNSLMAHQLVARSDGTIAVLAQTGEARAGDDPMLGRRSIVLRVDAGGRRDPSFGTDGLVILPDDIVGRSLLLRQDGSFVVGGLAPDASRGVLVALRLDGSLDGSFGDARVEP